MLPVRHPKHVKHIRIADPSKGILKYTPNEFKKLWTSSVNEEGERIGTALLLEPSPEFHESEESGKKTFAWQFLFKYLKNSFGPIFNITAALIVISLLQLLLPFQGRLSYISNVPSSDSGFLAKGYNTKAGLDPMLLSWSKT